MDHRSSSSRVHPAGSVRPCVTAIGAAAAAAMTGGLALAATLAPPPPTPSRVIDPVIREAPIGVMRFEPAGPALGESGVAFAVSVDDVGFGDPFAGSGPVPNPQLLDVRTLLAPDFARRSLPELVDGLDLDGDQSVIVETLLDDYLAAHEAAAKPLAEAIERYRSASGRRRMLSALAGEPVIGGDGPSGAVSFVRLGAPDGAVVAGASSGASIMIERSVDISMPDAARVPKAPPLPSDAPPAPDSVQADEVEALQLDERLDEGRRAFEALVERLRADLETTRAAGDADAESILRLATTLDGVRQSLRSEFIEVLRLLTEPVHGPADAAADAKLDGVLDRIRIAQRRPRHGLAGESLDLRLVVAGIDAPGDLARAIVAEHDADLAAMMLARDEAEIVRELAGLRALVARDAMRAETEPKDGDDPSAEPRVASDAKIVALTSAVETWARRGRAESRARIALRDVALGAAVAAADSMRTQITDGVGDRFSAESMRLAFPVEHRDGWTRRVLDAAYEIEDLTSEQRDALGALDVEATTGLDALRAEGIAERRRREPRQLLDAWDRAAERHDPTAADGEGHLTWSGFAGGDRPDAERDDDGLSLRDRRHRLERRVESGLDAILGADRMKALPERGVRVIKIGDQEIRLRTDDDGDGNMSIEVIQPGGGDGPSVIDVLGPGGG